MDEIEFIQMGDDSSFDSSEWDATLKGLIEEVGGCGQSADLFHARFSCRVEEELQQLPPEHLEQARERAHYYGYVPPSEQRAETGVCCTKGFCCHGFPEHCCPIGCDDVD